MQLSLLGQLRHGLFPVILPFALMEILTISRLLSLTSWCGLFGKKERISTSNMQHVIQLNIVLGCKFIPSISVIQDPGLDMLYSVAHFFSQFSLACWTILAISHCVALLVHKFKHEACENVLKAVSHALGMCVNGHEMWFLSISSKSVVEAVIFSFRCS